MRLLICLLTVLLSFTAAAAPSKHTNAVINHLVKAKIFKVRSFPGSPGGTGFAVRAPSGISYILTNAHICETSGLSPVDGSMLVGEGKGERYRRILLASGDSDLCILEGMPGVEGLNVAHAPVEFNQWVFSAGFPSLGDYRLGRGQVTGMEDVVMFHHMMTGDNKALNEALDAIDFRCDLPKFSIQNGEVSEEGTFKGLPVKACFVTETLAISTNIHTVGGSSGSPLLNAKGQVVGVIFATTDKGKWGRAVNLKQLKNFLSIW